MSRLINTSDLHEKVILNKPEWGIFSGCIENIIEGVVSQTPTAKGIDKKEVIILLEDIAHEYHELANKRMEMSIGNPNDVDMLTEFMDYAKREEKIKKRIETLRGY